MNPAQTDRSGDGPDRRTGSTRLGVRRRRGPSNGLHRALLWVVLAVGAAALTYNAVSIVSGEGGLAGLSQAFDAKPPLVAVAGPGLYR